MEKTEFIGGGFPRIKYCKISRSKNVISQDVQNALNLNDILESLQNEFVNNVNKKSLIVY